MQLRLCLSSDGRSDESLQKLTRDFCAALECNGGLRATIPEGPCAPGTRGDPITLGAVLLSVAPTAISGLMHVIKAYVERDSSLIFEFERPDGVKVVVTGKNLRAEELEKAVRMAEASAPFADIGGGKRYAVLIGSGAFPKEPRLAPLACPERDVDGLNAVLSSPKLGGFHSTEVLKNRPHFEGLRRINEMLNRAGKDDLTLIYYSGHGKLDGAGRLHLATADTEIDALESTSISLQRIRELMEVSRSQRIVLILDCCFSGAAGNAFFRSGVDDQLNMMSSGRGTYIMTASTAIQVAQEKGDDDYGLFTKHLIRGIGDGEADRDGDGYVTIDELYDYVHRGVVQEGAQRPMRWSLNVEGEIRIASSGRNSRQVRAKELKDLLFKLNNAGDIPDELLRQGLDVVFRRRDELTPPQRQQDELLDQLLQDKLECNELVWKWVKLQFQDTAPSQRADGIEQWFKSWPVLDFMKHVRAMHSGDADLIESIGRVRRFVDRVGNTMLTGQFGKWWDKKSH